MEQKICVVKKIFYFYLRQRVFFENSGNHLWPLAFRPMKLPKIFRSLLPRTVPHFSSSPMQGEPSSEETRKEDEVMPITLPDPAFRKYIMDRLRKEGIKPPEWDGTTIFRQDVVRITRIDIAPPSDRQEKIRSLDGIEHFTSLEYLAFPSHEVIRLDVRKNPFLTYLDGSYNLLEEILLGSSAALTQLKVTGNRLTRLDTEGLTALTLLDCADNRLNELKVGHLKDLTYLDCRKNRLTSLQLH